MKAFLISLGIMALAFAGFFGLVIWTFAGAEDQSALTERVDLTTSNARETTKGSTRNAWEFDYAYEHDGTWYGETDWIAATDWSPGDPLTACIDPDHPEDHVVTLRMQRCGQEVIHGNKIIEATPRPAPR